MRHSIRLAAAAVGLFLAACGRQSTMDEQMRQDLDAASASTMELAPSGGGQRVVSAIEQTGKVQPRVTKVRQVQAPAPTKKPETPQTVQQTATEPAATRPSQAPAVSPPPPGGYKTIGEVLKNAPFPIKP